MSSSSWFCVRTESKRLPSYDIRIEREILESKGVRLESIDMDDPGAFDRAAPHVDAVLHSRGALDAGRIGRLTRCRIIAHYGTGVDRVDVAAATARGIWVTNGPRYAVDEVSSHAIALLLAVARKIVAADRAVRAGAWHIKPIMPLHRIAGRTLGLLGFGNIARATGRKGRALGFDVIAYDPYLKESVFRDEGVRPVDLRTCLSEADMISVHLPLTDETRGIVSRETLGWMKPGAILVNTSRGPVVDEPALVEALRSGRLSGAGLDVFAEEPLRTDHPLLALPNVTVSGHIGFYSEESIQQMQRDAAEQVLEAMEGRPPAFLVNRQVLERPGR
ncbi:MAG TPA: C-terminal binding protein [bacterium]|nr:C-terminal binding protein [bacterium]